MPPKIILPMRTANNGSTEQYTRIFSKDILCTDQNKQIGGPRRSSPRIIKSK